MRAVARELTFEQGEVSDLERVRGEGAVAGDEVFGFAAAVALGAVAPAAAVASVAVLVALAVARRRLVVGGAGTSSTVLP